MANKRMFSKQIIDSDAFLDMPISSRLLYYDLAMRADDDGFVNSPKKIMKIVGATNDDMNVLITRKFIIPFETGVVVIKHWKIHNYIRSDTYKETTYKEEKAMLAYDENNAYKLKSFNPSTSRPRAVHEPYTQYRLDKTSIDKTSIDKTSINLFATAKLKMQSVFNPTTYSAWLDELELISVDDNFITIYIKNKLIAKTINENYLDKLTDILAETFNKNLKIKFEVGL